MKENLEQNAVPAVAWVIFHNLGFPELLKINVRNVPAQGVLLIRLSPAICTTRIEHDDLTGCIH